MNKTCPLCHRPVTAHPANGNWIMIAMCDNIHCPYSMELHGKGVSIPTPALQQAKLQMQKGSR